MKTKSYVMTSSNKIKFLILNNFLIICILSGFSTTTAVYNSKNSTFESNIISKDFDQTASRDDDFKNFQCFEENEIGKDGSLFNPGYKNTIGIRVSNRVTHQLTSRIFGIILHEILGYQNVELVPIESMSNLTQVEKLYREFEHLAGADGPLIDLEVWRYPDYHALPPHVFQAGLITAPGRYGWFTPTDFVQTPKENEAKFFEELHYSVFLNPSNPYYTSYVVDDESLKLLRNKFRFQNTYVPENCLNRTCATIFAQDSKNSAFIKQHIDEFRFYLNVIWFDDSTFKRVMDFLYYQYLSPNLRKLNKKYMLLHWTPSDVIDAETEYHMITMPLCEDMTSSHYTLCKYEMIPILKYYEEKFQKLRKGLDALSEFYISREDLKELLKKINTEKLTLQQSANLSAIYNDVACQFLRNNKRKYLKFRPTKNVLTIGGIFPLTGTGKAYGKLFQVVGMAVEAINTNPSVLPNFLLNVQMNDGKCRADTVMKAFIHYFNLASPLIGVLGPACSETVEPIAGVSKHTRMTVISYSAEGALFTDRDTYPYFFRTIGSNRQYERVYLDLFKKLNWRRMAALTEDGQKYTEYISHMDTIVKQEENMELIMNKKFPRDVSKSEMNRLLLEFKNKHAKIIIADIYNDNAQLVMCEAYHLQMTAKHGYVWFLPVWLSRSWMHEPLQNQTQNLTCTADQLYEAINGHFSLTHAPFAANNSIIEGNITVEEWMQIYEYNNQDEPLSDYAGFVYDAVWVYALAADKLLRENPSAVYDLRSPEIIKRLNEIIWQTDFNGLSGRIRFGEGGSRVNDVNVLQWVNGKFHQIGKYSPEIQEYDLKIIGGNLTLNESEIIWLSNEHPKDGTFQCTLATLAEFFHTDCDNIKLSVIIFLLVIAVLMLSVASFMYWKCQYNKKLKQSAKVMRNFGIDLLSPNAQTHNTLDKWEIPKEDVVINRRLGEGAFGTVYGGEAKINDSGWTAVAVKTLKAGASTEDRLDFLSEAEAMKRFDHKNIIKLLGVCLQSEPIYTIMEFMLYGDLKTFLLARRHLVNEKITDDSDISAKRLSIYALDVARGLSYLAAEKYVHRDIACRNCLVNAQRVVKIGDFGMARPTFESDYYRFNRKGMLPVRWMAPESLGLGVFTPASDVWSFGVLLYEIITFGSFPYQGLTNNQVLEHIKQGNILDVPRGAKPHLEALMLSCWCQEYKKRPSATEIMEFITLHPRLLTPCLDVPISSVQMAETDSDQLELLPGIRKRVATQPDLDILARASNINNFDQRCNVSMNDRILDVKNITNDESSIENGDRIDNVIGNSNEENNLNGYSVMSPLLKVKPEITASNSSLKRYVPMYSIGKHPKNNNNNNSNDLNRKQLLISDIELVEIPS